MIIQQILPDVGVYYQLSRFFIIFLAGLIGTKLVLMPLTRRIVSRTAKEEGSVDSMVKLTGSISIFLSFIVALQAAQFGNLVTVLGAITAAATVAIGFGMRDQIANVMGGVFILTDNQIKKGDYIKVKDELEGRIREIKLRHTMIDRKGSRIVVPNIVLTLNPVNNLSSNGSLNDSLSIEVNAEKALEAEKILEKAAEENEKLLEKPEPKVTHDKINGDKVELSVLYWFKKSGNVSEVRSNLIKEITKKLNREEIIAGEG